MSALTIEREPTALPVARDMNPIQMLALAVQQGADIDKMRMLMDMKREWEADEGRKAFVVAMAEFKANPPEILKRKEVSFGNTHYKHATLADVCAAAIAGLAKVGISHRWTVTQAEKTITVDCVLTHRLGHSESVSLTSAPDTSGQKNAIQAIASAVTYLQRYTLLAATGLAASDMDTDGKASAPAETITDAQAADLQALAEEVGANREQFLRYLKVERLADLPASKYQAALRALEAKRAK